MSTLNARQVLSNLYGLIIEINYHRTDEDVLNELRERPDSQVEKHLINVKQISTKLKAHANMALFQEALNQLKFLKQKGTKELRKLFPPDERHQPELVQLFRKFEEITAKDEQAILEDQELLLIMKLLNDKLNNKENG